MQTEFWRAAVSYFDPQWFSQFLTGAWSGICAAFLVFAPWLAFRKFPNLSNAVDAIFAGFRRSDAAIARIGDFLVGTKLTGWRRPAWFYFLVCAVSLGVMVTSAKLTAVFLSFGLFLIFVVLRHWSRDEAKRRLQTEAQHVRVSTDRDLRFEAASAIVLLFVIAPLGFSKLDSVYPIFSRAQGSRSALLDTAILLAHCVGFTWFELTHALPVVHAAFSVIHEGPIFIKGDMTPILRAALFALRLAYELFVVGAVVELVGVGIRIAHRQDMRPIEDLLRGDEEQKKEAVALLKDLAVRQRIAAFDMLVKIINGRPERVRDDYLPESGTGDPVVELQRDGESLKRERPTDRSPDPQGVMPEEPKMTYSRAVRAKAREALAAATGATAAYLSDLAWQNDLFREQAIADPDEEGETPSDYSASNDASVEPTSATRSAA